jgi:hypothetical protein
VLGALVLALHHDAGRKVGQADRGVGLVDVLPARAAGAVGVDPEIALVDLDRDGVVDLRDDRDARERGVTAGLGVEGRDAPRP